METIEWILSLSPDMEMWNVWFDGHRMDAAIENGRRKAIELFVRTSIGLQPTTHLADLLAIAAKFKQFDITLSLLTLLIGKKIDLSNALEDAAALVGGDIGTEIFWVLSQLALPLNPFQNGKVLCNAVESGNTEIVEFCMKSKVHPETMSRARDFAARASPEINKILERN